MRQRPARFCPTCSATLTSNALDEDVYPCGHDPQRQPVAKNQEEGVFSDLLGAYENVGKPRQWFAQGAIEGTPIVVLAAGEKIGKSWMLIDLVVSAAIGAPWLGRFPVMQTGTPWYLDTEYGLHEFTRRAARLIRGKGHDPRKVLPLIKHVWATEFVLDQGNPLAQKLFATAAETKPPVICIDPWRNVLNGDENSAADTIAGLGVAAKFRDAAGCPIAIAHHLNRQGTMSGSRALKGRADLFLEASDEDEPWFSTIGRTLRRGDDISQKFNMRIVHEGDHDDTIAKTTIVVRFEGEAVGKSSVSKSALRVLDVLKTATRPMSKKALRDKTSMNHPVVSRALDDLLGANLVTLKEDRWSVTAGTFFDALKEES